MHLNAERIPVIVGVGQVNDRPDQPGDGLDPVGLMAEALRQAERDGAAGLLTDCDSLAVVTQIGWPQLNPVEDALCAALGIDPSHRTHTPGPNGDGPTRLLNDAANRIGAGEAVICAIVGGEALRTAGQLAALKPREDGEKPNALRDAPHRRKEGYAQSYGLTLPVDVYPLYENAARSAWGQSLAEGQAESGALWAGMSAVAANNEHAWLSDPVSAEEVVTPSSRNRPIAFPYTKFQVANASVNQGAGFIVTSLAEARRRGIAEDRVIHIGYGAAAQEDADFLKRDSYAASPSLAVSIERALDLNALSASDLDHVELYSCFPCVPKLARRVLGWPVDRPITVFGGLTFGGGPIGNYMSHAVASMVERLRDHPGKGLLFANGGYATYNHTIILSSEPTGARFPQDYDYQAEADARRGPIPAIAEAYLGPVTLETYTVHYDRGGEVRMGTVVARTASGERVLACVPADDRETLESLTDGARDPIGLDGTIEAGADELRRFRFC